MRRRTSSISYRNLVALSITRASDTDPVLQPLLDIVLLFREEGADPSSGPEEDR